MGERTGQVSRHVPPGLAQISRPEPRVSSSNFSSLPASRFIKGVEGRETAPGTQIHRPTIAGIGDQSSWEVGRFTNALYSRVGFFCGYLEDGRFNAPATNDV